MSDADRSLRESATSTSLVGARSTADEPGAACVRAVREQRAKTRASTNRTPVACVRRGTSGVQFANPTVCAHDLNCAARYKDARRLSCYPPRSSDQRRIHLCDGRPAALHHPREGFGGRQDVLGVEARGRELAAVEVRIGTARSELVRRDGC